MLTQEKVNEFGAVYGDTLRPVSKRQRLGKWQCKLPEMLVGEYLLVPCISAKMLKSEGYWMNNCSRDYMDACAAGEYCIFSIRSRTGERLATLGLINDSSGWRFDQCYGPSNADVMEETYVYLDDDGELHSESFPTDIYYIAHEVVRLMNSEPCLVM